MSYNNLGLRHTDISKLVFIHFLDNLYFVFYKHSLRHKLVKTTNRLTTNVKVAVFWDLMPRCLTEFDIRFRGAYCLSHRDLSIYDKV
jgi:hypothetical protein